MKKRTLVCWHVIVNIMVSSSIFFLVFANISFIYLRVCLYGYKLFEFIEHTQTTIDKKEIWDDSPTFLHRPPSSSHTAMINLYIYVGSILKMSLKCIPMAPNIKHPTTIFLLFEYDNDNNKSNVPPRFHHKCLSLFYTSSFVCWSNIQTEREWKRITPNLWINCLFFYTRCLHPLSHLNKFILL